MTSAHLTQLRKWLINSPPGEWILQRVRDTLIGALRQGPIPRHVAFVMDGNRRYAREHKIETVEGHHLGFEALARILEVCYKSGVTVVTIYAFSIENFKRPKFEVDALMDMAKVKLTQLSEHGALLERYGAKIQILGQMDLVRPDVIETMNKAVEMTKHNEHAILNVCFSYTSRDEMTTAIRETVRDFSQPLRPTPRRPFSETRIARTIRSRQLGNIPEDQKPRVSSPLTHETILTDGDDTEESTQSFTSTIDTPTSSRTSVSNYPVQKPIREHNNYPDPETITANTITDHMFTAGNPPVDLLVRTSNVQRLSDFMLWQCHEHTSLVFLDCLWPEFDLWHFLPVLVEWQWRQRKAEELESSTHVLVPRLKLQ